MTLLPSLTMPSKQRKTPARRLYETIERPKQAHFTPRHRTISAKNHSFSAPSSKQQTLTQIDFVSRVPVEEEDLDLDYVEEVPRARKRRKTMPARTDAEYEDEDEDATYVEEQPREKKRRKTVPNAAPISRRRNQTTKNSKGQIIDEAQNDEGEQANETLPRGEASPVPADVIMPPPKTPRMVMKTEIPSSQSPATTPLSIHGRRSTRNVSRSPLKTRSTNIRTTRMFQNDSEGNTVKRMPRQLPELLVRDTFDNQSEGSDISVQSRRSESGVMEKALLGVPLFPTGVLATNPKLLSTEKHTSITTTTSYTEQESTTARRTSTHGLPKSLRHQNIDSNIQDPNNQKGDECPDAEEFDAGLDTQAALENAGSTSSRPSIEHERMQDPVEDFNNAIRAAAARNFSASTKNYVSDHGVDFNNSVGRGVARPFVAFTKGNTTSVRPRPSAISRQAEGGSIAEDNLSASTTRGNVGRSPKLTQVPRTPPPHVSDSDQASAQLEADLYRETQPLAETLIRTASLLPGNYSKPEPTPIFIKDDDDDKVPTSETYRTPSSAPQVTSSAHRPCPVPSSQATTIDVTQPTQRSPPPSHILVPSSPPAPSLPPLQNPAVAGRPAVLRRPVPPFILSSSPLGSGGELSSQFEWDGKPLTDSQLLPDSLMNMTLPKPPPWGLSQESLLEEEGFGEGYED